MDKVNTFINQVDKELTQKFPVLNQIDEKVQVPKAKTYGVIVVGILYVLLLIFNVAGQLLTNLLGFVYPAYQSILAIESPTKKDDTQWLVYWTVFGLLSTIEYFSAYIVHWLPFYYIIKATFLVYMWLPQIRGAELLYTKFIRPLLMSNQWIISDSTMGKAKKATSGDKSD